MQARKIIGDQNSAEFDALRRSHNNLLRILEGVQASLTAGATAEACLAAIAQAVITGVDSNPTAETNVVATGCALEGLKPTPMHPRRVQGGLETSTKSDTY